MNGFGTYAKLAARMAWGTDRELRFRQVLLTGVSILAFLGVVSSLGLMSLQQKESEAISERAGRLIDVRADGSLTADPETAPIFARVSIDRIAGRDVAIVFLDPRVPTPPLPPGLDAIPDVGDFVVTPALDELLEANPSAALRYGTTSLAAADGVASGEELLAWSRHADDAEEDQLRPIIGFGDPGNGAAVEEWVLDRTVPGAAVAAIALLLVIVPLTALLVIAARSSSVTRDRRFDLLSKLGTTRLTLRTVGAIEGLVVVAPGVLLGAMLSVLVLPRFTGLPLLRVDLLAGRLGATPPSIAIAAIVVTGTAAIASLPNRRPKPTGEAARTAGSRLGVFAPFTSGVVLFVVGASGTSSTYLAILLASVLLLAAAAALAVPKILAVVGTALASTGRVSWILSGRRISANKEGIGTSLAALAFLIVLSSAALSWIALADDDEVPPTAQFVVPSDAPTTSEVQQRLGEIDASMLVASIVQTQRGVELVASCDDLARAAAIADFAGCTTLSPPLVVGDIELPFDGIAETTSDGSVLGTWLLADRTTDVDREVRAAVRDVSESATVLTNSGSARPGRVQPWIEWGLAVAGVVSTSALLILVLQRAVARRPTEHLISSLGATRLRIALMEGGQLLTSFTVTIIAATSLGIVLGSRLVAFGKSERTPYLEIMAYGAAVWLVGLCASATAAAVAYSASGSRRSPVAVL